MNLLRMAIQSIAANRIRAVLSVIALTSAVVGLVVVSAASETVERTVTQRAIIQGGPAATFRLNGPSGTRGLVDQERLMHQLGAWLPGETVVPAVSLVSSAIESSNATLPTRVLFTSVDYRSIHPFELVEGQWLGSSTEQGVVIRMVLNLQASSSLDARVGDLVRLRVPGVTTDQAALVVGIVDDANPDERAYAELTGALDFLSANSRGVMTAIEVSAPALAIDQLQQRAAALNSFAGLSTSWSIDRTDTVEKLAREVASTRATFLIVGFLGLLASLVGVANVGLSTLRERSAETSLRVALGAKRWHIAASLVIESQLIALVASILALGVAYLAYPLIAAQFSAPYGIGIPAFPWVGACIAALIGGAAALFGAAAPAVHSMRMPLGSVLRA